VSSPAPRLRQVSPSSAPPSENMHCVPMEECPAYRHSVSSVCGCCGLQFGIQYPLPPTMGAYGNLSAFKVAHTPHQDSGLRVSCGHAMKQGGSG
jgi:hypothetical protein